MKTEVIVADLSPLDLFIGMNAEEIVMEICKLDGATGDWVADYLNFRDAIVPVVLRWCGTDLQRRSKFLCCLRDEVGIRAPKNKVGTPMVSDFDLITAMPGEYCLALLKAAGRYQWEKSA